MNLFNHNNNSAADYDIVQLKLIFLSTEVNEHQCERIIVAFKSAFYIVALSSLTVITVALVVAAARSRPANIVLLTTLPTASLRFSPVRSTRSSLIQPVCHHCRRLSLPHLHSRPSDPVQRASLRRLIMSSSVKSSSLDPIPTFLVREFIDIMLPYTTKMVNSLLTAGRLPT